MLGGYNFELINRSFSIFIFAWLIRMIELVYKNAGIYLIVSTVLRRTSRQRVVLWKDFYIRSIPDIFAYTLVLSPLRFNAKIGNDILIIKKSYF